MKKTLLAGVLAASMAISSSAFAAVEYGNANQMPVVYDDEAVTVTVTGGVAGEGQKTVVVLDTDGAIVADNILYIDQAEAGADIFQAMGLLTGKDEETGDPVALAAGTYYVKVGGEDGAILVASFTVTEDGGYEDVTFYCGDVNGDNAVDSSDALLILAKGAGGAAKVGASAYAIGAEIASSNFCGDVNGDKAVDSSDALLILAKGAGGAAKVGASAYAIGEAATVQVAK